METTSSENIALSNMSISTSSLALHEVGNTSVAHTSIIKKDTHINKVWYFHDFYLSIVFINVMNAFALTTNTLNVMVLIKQGVRTCVSLCLLSISATDLISTLIGMMTLPAKVMTYMNVRSGLDPFALYYIAAYTCGVFYDVSNTLTSFLSLERCLCVCLPIRFKDIFTTKRTAAIIFFIYVLCFGLMIPHFQSSGFVWRTSGNSTYLALWVSPDRAAVDVYIDIMHFCQTTIILSVVFLCTTIMLVTLKRSSKFQRGNARSNVGGTTVSAIGGTGVELSSVPGSKLSRLNNGSKIENEIENPTLGSHRVNNDAQKRGPDEPKKQHSKNKVIESQEIIRIADIKFSKDTKKKRDESKQSSRNANVMKTVVILCAICFTCNLSRVMFAIATRVEPRFRFGKEYGVYFQFFLAILYLFQVLNCSLNIFVYHRYNQSFRAALKQIIVGKPKT